MKLFKISAPGWERDFESESELKSVLYSYICNICRKGVNENEYVEPPIYEDSTLSEMLASPCGCEFDVEKDE